MVPHETKTIMERISWRYFAIISVVALSVCLPNINGDEDWRLDEDTEGWVDPHSMIETKPSKKTSTPAKEVFCEKAENDCSVSEKALTECGDQVVKLKKDLETQKELSRKLETTASKEQPFFEQYLRHILSLFTRVKDGGTNVGHYEAAISLSGLHYGYLSSYVTKQNVSVQEVHSILLKLITNVRWVKDDNDLNDFDDGSDVSFAAQFRYYLNVAGAVAVIMVALLQVVSLLRRVRMSLSRFVFLLLVTTVLTSFIISIPWTWWHLYKKKVAERMAATSRRPPDCVNQMSSIWRTFLSNFFIQNDECQKYFEQLEIDPLWEVPPTQAVAVTFVRFFLEPAKHIGQAIREFMVSAFEGLPIVLWLPVYAFIILLFILVLFCLGRYRISLPFLSIEPARSDGAHQVAALQDRVEQLQLENRDMRRQLAPPDAPGNAIDERGDRRRTPLQLERPPTVGVQDIERLDVKKTEEKKKSPRKLKNVPTDSECAYASASLCSATGPDETTPVSATEKSRPTQDDTTPGLTIAELIPENLPTASRSEPIAELEELKANGEDLQQSYVMITKDAELDENAPRDNKTGATDATEFQAVQVTDLVKSSLM